MRSANFMSTVKRRTVIGKTVYRNAGSFTDPPRSDHAHQKLFEAHFKDSSLQSGKCGYGCNAY